MSTYSCDNETSTDLPPLRILIVDDFEPDIRFMQRMLKSSLVSSILPPFIMRSVNSIGKALTLYQSYRPDCILLDYNLPDMSGLDLVEAILPTDGELATAIVMMTGAGDENIAVQAMKLGVHDYLVKGQVTEEQLGWTIHSALERLQLQRQLNDKHEELELFASRASHDMISPLTNLSLYVECLQEQFADELDDSDETFHSIISIVDHMTSLIDGLSTYAQVGRSNVNFDMVDLQELHRYILLVSESAISETQAKVTVQNLPTVYGDRVGLSQLFQNLIANSLKYWNGTAPEVEISATDEGSHFHIAVKDTGIGIDPMHHSEIFAPFRRLHSRTEYGGCGLGLATCKKIVQQHHGRIWVESIPSKGTTMHIDLPKFPDRRVSHRIISRSKLESRNESEYRNFARDGWLDDLSEENILALGAMIVDAE